MTESTIDGAGADAANLLVHYSFDLDGYTIDTLVHHWLRQHPSLWLRTAVIECLYQGRYKAVSVEQLLTLWQRRGQPRQHFNHEFERMVCSKLPRNLLIDTVLPPNVATGLAAQIQTHSGEGASTNSARNEVSRQIEAAIDPHPQKFASEAAPPPDRPPIAPSSSFPLLAAESAPGQIAALQPTIWENLAETAGWSDREAVKQPIHQFVPTESSTFCAKLKAVSQPLEPEPIASTATIALEPPEERSPSPTEDSN